MSDQPFAPMKKIPLLNIHQFCEEREIHSFKVTPFSEVRCTAIEFEENHRHEYFEIIWLKHGTGIHQIDLCDHPYEGSVIFMLAPGQIHQIQQQIPSEGYIIKFLPSLFKYENDFFDYILDTCLFDTVTTCSIIKIPENIYPIVEDLFIRLMEEYHQPEVDSENILRSYLKILITHINRIKRKKINGETVVINDPHYVLFRKFKIAVEKNYKNEHTVQGYADLLNTQTRTLNTVARKYSGKSAGELIQERILLEAKRYLYHETRSIKEICFELGFEDPAYFTRFFKKHMGISPQQFKPQKNNHLKAF